jgi:hypothetical protein
MIGIYYANFHALLRYGLIFCVGDNEINSTFKLPEKGYTSNSGVSNMSCGQTFQDFNILPLACFYILEILRYITKYKESLEQNVQIHNY